MAINGMPRKMGLINWSKKLSAMVSFRILFLVFPCFERSAHLEMCGLLLLGELQLGEQIRRRLG